MKFQNLSVKRLFGRVAIGLSSPLCFVKLK